MLTSQDGTREWGEQLFKTIPLDDVDEKKFSNHLPLMLRLWMDEIIF